MEVVPKPAITKIILCSQSALKSDTLASAVSQFDWIKNAEIILKDSQPEKNPVQPVNSGHKCAVNRINQVHPDPVEESTILVAIENEIRLQKTGDGQNISDVAHVVIRRGEDIVSSRSFGIPLSEELYKKAELQSEESSVNREFGLSVTVGSVIHQLHPEVSSDNWMKDARFGGIDRKDQILDALVATIKKLYIHQRITYADDFPKPGVRFRDLAYVLSDSLSFQFVGECLKQEVVSKGWHKNLTKVMGFDARGFIYGTMLARELGIGFIMIRKKGKLPGKTVQVTYKTEYSEDVLELVAGTIEKHDRILLVDDVIATGGTFGAGIQAIEESGGAHVVGCAVVMKVAPLEEIANQKIAPIEFVSLF